MTQATGLPDPRRRRHADAAGLAVLTILFAVWHVFEGGDGRFQLSGAGLFVAAALVAAAISGFATRRAVDDTRLAWLFVTAGCAVSAVGIALFARLQGRDDVSGSFTPLHVGWVVLVVSLAAGLYRLGRPEETAEERRKLILDLTPTTIALTVAVWLAVFGPSAIDVGASWQLRAAAAIHGVGALAVFVAALAATLRRSRTGGRTSLRTLSLSAALLAAADLLWLQPWLGGREDASLVAEFGFLAGFFGVAHAALRGSAARDTGASRPDHLAGETRKDLLLLAPHISLLALLLIAWFQIRFGDLQPYGVETAVVGSVAVVVFVMIREGIAQRNARSLRGEIGQLTEQIDGLIRQVGRDPLTGLLNRRAVLSRIEHELFHGRTCGHSVAVALIDVDNFKTVNDTLGHQAGDRVLLAVGSILTAACRGTDVAARYAGDEFILLLPGLGEEVAGQVCERIVQDVRRLADELELGGIRVTLSVGAAVTHHCKRTATQLIAIADAAMYDAKEGGKDRVVAINADTLVPAGTPAAELVPPRTDLTYLPSSGVRAVTHRRVRDLVDRAS